MPVGLLPGPDRLCCVETPETLLRASEWRQLLWCLARQLHGKQGALLFLMYVQGLTLTGVAQLWHVRPSAVHAMRTRALKSLRSKLEKQGIHAGSDVI